MAVKIRLRRVGRKKQPSYRMVVIESENPRGGAYLDTVGFYNPQQKPASLQIDLNKIDSWIKRGATDSLVRKARRGGDKTVAVSDMPRGPVAAAAPAAAEPAPAVSAAPAAAEQGREGEPGAGEPVVPQEPEAAAAERAESVE